MILSTLVLVYSPLTKSLAGFESKFISLIRMDNASTARIPVAANNITYVLSRILSQTFNISTISSFDSASFFFLTTLGSFTFNLNLRGLMSMSEYSKKLFTVTIRCFNVSAEILQFLRYAA
jgi:hypothetical protein